MDHDKAATRLEKLYHADPGFFCIATHAWMEAWCQKLMPWLRAKFTRPDGICTITFQNYLEELRRVIGSDSAMSRRWAGSMGILKTVEGMHKETNTVRHAFATMRKERADDYLNTLITFMQNAGVDPAIRDRLVALRQTGPLDYQNLLRDLVELRAENREIRESLAVAEEKGLASLQTRLDELQADVREKEREIQRLHDEGARLDSKAGRVDQLRAEMTDHKKKILELQNLIDRVSKREAFYRSMACHSRTRVLLERNLMQLGFDQEEAVRQFHDQPVFLVKGQAGSGKTIVLLKCVARALELAGQGELLEGPDSRPLVMNWGKRVQAYSEYQIKVHEMFEGDQVEMKTVDSWLAGLVKKHVRLDVDWTARLADLVARMGAIEGLAGVEAELEMLWTRGVMTRESYLEYSRIGMGRALARAQREAVWSLHDKLAEQSLAEGKVVPSLAWWLLLRHLTQAGQSAAHWARIFVDECQDLTGTKLAILRLQADHLVLAGDSEQMIYRGTSPFLDAGMDMRRVTSVTLSQVYRNTVPIFQFASRVRAMILDAEDTQNGHATRMGPLPEVHFETGWNGLLDHLVERIRMLAFREDSLYEPGSIAILTLGRPEDYAARLEARNIKVRIAKHDDVDFSKTDAVFVSSIHTAKGMDFPVVFVLLDEIDELRRHYLDDGADPAACSPRLMRLLYVASTRGMDILEIFCQQSGGREVPEVRAIKAAHQEMLALYDGDGVIRHPG